jgi:hypothetical protein
LQSADREDDSRLRHIVDLERQLEDALVRQELGHDGVEKEFKLLQSEIASLSTVPDRRTMLRRGIAERNAELSKVQRAEATREAVRLAKKLRPAVARLEAELATVAAAIADEMAHLNAVYSAAVDGKLVGKTRTPRKIVYATVVEQFQFLRPVIEASASGTGRPLSGWIESIISQGEKRG